MSSNESSSDLDSRISAIVDSTVGRMRDELLQRVEATESRLRDITGRLGVAAAAEPAPGPEAAPEPPAAGDAASELFDAVVAIDRGSSQQEVLAALLEGVGRFASRSALFLTRSDGAQGWGSYGFAETGKEIQETVLSYGEGAMAVLAEGHGCVLLTAEECGDLCGRMGVSPGTEGMLVPFVLRDRLAAAMYVDRFADDPPLARRSVQLLAHVGAQAVEGLAVRQRNETPTLQIATEEAAAPGVALWEAPPAEPEPEVEAEVPTVEAEPEVPVVEPEPEAAAEPIEVEPEVAAEPVVAEPEVTAEPVVAEPEVTAEPVVAEPEAPMVEPTLTEPALTEAALTEPAFTAPQIAEPDEVVEIPAVGMPLEEIPAEAPTEAPIEAPPGPEAEKIADTEWEVTPPPMEETAEVISPVEEPGQPLETLAEPAPVEPAEETQPWTATAGAGFATVEAEPAAEPAEVMPPAEPEPGAGLGETTEVSPPTDISGPGWAFTASRSAAESGDDAQHEEARRLARLLVTEIKLYNEEQVEEGRRGNDIYSRLREDIDRSRQIFNERVDEAVRNETDYFHEEMVRILAGGNAEALGL